MIVRAWAIAAVLAVLGESVARLAGRALEAFAGGLTPLQWAAFAASAAALGYGEGWLALHKRFAPAVVERAREAAQGGPLLKAFAPLYALSLIDGDRRRLLRGWAVLALVTLCVGAVRALPAPWRGIVDGAVCIALALGSASLAWRAALQALRPSA